MKAVAGWLIALLMASTTAHAFGAASVPEPKRTGLGQCPSSREAAKFMDRNASTALFLDVRTPGAASIERGRQPPLPDRLPV